MSNTDHNAREALMKSKVQDEKLIASVRKTITEFQGLSDDEVVAKVIGTVRKNDLPKHIEELFSSDMQGWEDGVHQTLDRSYAELGRVAGQKRHILFRLFWMRLATQAIDTVKTQLESRRTIDTRESA